MTTTPEHIGRLLSGQIICDCGWESGRYSLASDAVQEFNDHLTSEGVTE